MGRAALLVVTSLVLLAGCSPGAYHKEAQIYIAEAQEVLSELHERRLCETQMICPMVKFRAGGGKLGPVNFGGVSINVYDVRDSAIANKLISRFKQKHAELPDVPVSLHVYASKHGKPK